MHAKIYDRPGVPGRQVPLRLLGLLLSGLIAVFLAFRWAWM
jgi:hypothetical protein